MTTPHAARPRHGHDRAQPARPSKPPEYMQQQPSDASGASPSPRRVHNTAPNTDTYGSYSTHTHHISPPPIPPQVGGSARNSNTSVSEVPKPFAQKVRDTAPDDYIAELEADITGLGLSNVDFPAEARRQKKKGRKVVDTEDLAQEIVKERKLRVLSLDGGGIRGYSTLVILSDLMHRIHVLINRNVPVESHRLPRPCDFFDIIGGNGTGGLIALMLGRMRMDVETCKEYYEALTRYVFFTDKTILGMPYGNTLFKASRLEEAIRVCVRECTRYDHLPLLPYVSLDSQASPSSSALTPIQPASTIRGRGSRKGSWGKERNGTTSTFSSFPSSSTVAADSHDSKGSDFTSFADARGRRIDNTLGNPDASLYDHRVGACKTFVTTSYIASGRGAPPVILRSYQTAREPDTVSTKATIWQAGRATCATRSAFKPITIANVQFLDEGYGKYNPALSVLEEALAKETWHDVDDVLDERDGKGPEIGVFVSVGTGKRFTTTGDGSGGLRKDKPLWWESMGMLEQYSEAKKRLLEKIEDCENVHLSLLNGELQKNGVDKANYFRFNVEVGVGEFGMNEWNRLAEVSTGTRRYLARPDVEKEINLCAEKLTTIWRTNGLRGVGAHPAEEEVKREIEVPTAEEEARRKRERAKRRAARKDSAAGKGGTKWTPSSPPTSSISVAELEADIDKATSEWSSDPENHASPRRNIYEDTPPQDYTYPPVPPKQQYFSPQLPPTPQRPPQGYQPPHVSHWVQNLPGGQQNRPIPIPTPGDFLPPIIFTSPPPNDPNVREDYFSGIPSEMVSYPPEISVTSPTTVGGDSLPGTPMEIRRVRSIEGDRQARRERRERKTRKERDERERSQ